LALGLASMASAQDDCPRPKIEPLSAARYRLEATISSELNDIVEDIKNLMAHRNPTRDVEMILDVAFRDLHEKLQKERFAKTSRPAKAKVGAPKKSTRRGYIPRPVRREVFERDGAQCTYLDEQGRRCKERGCLELHHIVSKALGGPDTVENLTVRCRPHNLRDAEKVFGREHVEQRINFERSKYATKRSPAFEAAARGLASDLGFPNKDVRAALDKVAQDLDPSTSSAEAVIRAALRLLT
jgi:5-methylcytosine-specific restriction endonuclease McrA